MVSIDILPIKSQEHNKKEAERGRNGLRKKIKRRERGRNARRNARDKRMCRRECLKRHFLKRRNIKVKKEKGRNAERRHSREGEILGECRGESEGESRERLASAQDPLISLSIVGGFCTSLPLWWWWGKRANAAKNCSTLRRNCTVFKRNYDLLLTWKRPFLPISPSVFLALPIRASLSHFLCLPAHCTVIGMRCSVSPSLSP